MTLTEEYKKLIKEMKEYRLVKNLDQWEKQRGEKCINLKNEVNELLKLASRQRNIIIKSFEVQLFYEKQLKKLREAQ